MQIQKLNVRTSQAYAAICLKVYAEHQGIDHIAVKDLVRYLFSILIAEALPDWEQEGCQLTLPGRGDPLPADLASKLSESQASALHLCIENAVEVSLSVFYGEITDAPFEFLQDCLAMLKDSGVPQPDVNPLVQLDQSEDGFGKPIDSKSYRNLAKRFGITV